MLFRLFLLQTLQNPRNSINLHQNGGRAKRALNFGLICVNSLDFVRFAAISGENYFIFWLFLFSMEFSMEFY